MVNPPETKKPISKPESAELAKKNTESLTPPDLKNELKKMFQEYNGLAKSVAEKDVHGQETTTTIIATQEIKKRLLEKIRDQEMQYYPVSHTSNSIAIQNKSIELQPDKFQINFTYFLVNENKDQLTDEYGYMHLLGDYFLVATVTDKTDRKYGLSFLIDKNSGQILNETGYEEIKLMGHDKIIAKRGQKRYWICSNKQQYKMPLGSEMTSGHIQIIQDKDGYLWGYEHDLAKEKLLIPQSVKIDNQSPIFTPPKNDKMAA